MDDVANLSDEFLITREFQTANDFSIFIEQKAVTLGATCLDIITEYCEEKDIDTSSVAVLITPSLKEKLREEAEQLNLIKKSSEKLPI